MNPQPGGTMDRNYVLPLAIATAIHVGLFYGYPAAKPPVRQKSLDLIEVKDPIKMPPREEEPPPVAEREPQQKASNEPPPPSILDTPAPNVDPGAITQQIRPPVESPLGPMTTIPFDPGPGGGVPKVEVLRLRDLDNVPRTRAMQQPVYPYEAKRVGLEGHVSIE